VMCPPGLACTVRCDGRDACGDMQVMCSEGPCQMDCATGDACTGAAVACGSGACGASCAMGGDAPMLTCGTSCGCAGC